MFYVTLTFLVLRIRLQKQSPPVETTSVKCFSFLAFLMEGVLNTYIHSVGGRDGIYCGCGVTTALKIFRCLIGLEKTLKHDFHFAGDSGSLGHRAHLPVFCLRPHLVH